MKLQTHLRRLSFDGTGYPLTLRETLVRAASRIDDLEAMLRNDRQQHDVICNGTKPCNCGADAANEKVDQLLAAGEMDVHRERA
jgi:hypothetical protein